MFSLVCQFLLFSYVTSVRIPWVDHAQAGGVSDLTVNSPELLRLLHKSALSSKIPGRRLASYHEALFYPPPAKLDVRLSTHPAFQWLALLRGQPCSSRTLPHSQQAVCHPSPCR